MEIITEKRTRITKPYKALCNMWRKIAIGIMLLSLILAFFLIQSIRGNNRLQYERASLIKALDNQSTISIMPTRGKK